MHAPNTQTPYSPRERGQALVEYALILALVAVTFGIGLAAAGSAAGDVFNRIVGDVLRQTQIADVDAPGKDDFWETVTNVYLFTPASGSGLATNTSAPPTAVGTAGPSPTFTHTYTHTPPTPSATPTPTRTPVDQQKNAPFKDTVDEFLGNKAGWWRIDNNVILRGTPWTMRLFGNTTLGGTADHIVPGLMEVDLNGAFYSNYPTGSPGQNFSARLERKIQVPAALPERAFSIRILADDGVRLFVNGAPVTLRDVNGSTNSWTTQGAPVLWTANVTLPSGEHDLRVEYYNTSGTARLKINVTGSGANPDDRPVTAGQPYSCNWGFLENANNANTESNVFDDYVDGVSSPNTICYLEWRGAVLIPSSMTRPELVFWDIWDLPTGSEVWVEVAEYIPVDATATIKTANRAAMTWQRVNLSHTTGGTANYNWTRNVIDLNPLMTGFVSSSPKWMAFRFVMRTGTVNSTTKWHIDDIEIRDGTSTTITANRIWTLDDDGQKADFITTGGRSNPGVDSGWNLVSNNRFGTTGKAWHDSVNPLSDDPNFVAGYGPTGNAGYTPYKRHTDSPNSDLQNNVRIHALEFNGFIDLANVPNPDLGGNTGAPVLSFYHAFDVGARTGLQVQYTTDAYSVSPANWQTLPGGNIRAITLTNTATSLTLQEYVVPLSGLPGNPPQIRIRFAMLVHVNAGLRDGWWIDQIRLGRAEENKWLNYPFFDNAQGNGRQLFWSYSGLWAPTTVRGYPGLVPQLGVTAASYSTSPFNNYANGQTTYLTMRWPIDLYNDTPNKRVIEDDSGNILPANSRAAPAVNPELTFYFWRGLNTTDDFRVEWKRASEADTAWRPLWLYRYGMTTNPSSTNARTAINESWEYARVSLYPILRQIALDGGGAPGVGTGAALVDDDIVLRFGLRADGSSNSFGVFVDDIRIAERNEQVLKLWPSSESRVNPVGGAPLGVGTGASFAADPDLVSTGQSWRDVFRLSGDWNIVSYAAQNGTLSFHDSPIGDQNRAPTGFYDHTVWATDFGANEWRTRHRTFSTIELEPIIDLRGVTGEDEAPMLSFWTRYHLGQSDYAMVQISVEDNRTAALIDGSMNARCASLGIGLLQCYEQERGWSAWQTVWTRGNTSGPENLYAWQRMLVDLTPYAYLRNSNTEGKRIRIRFVYDAYYNSSNRDGWYIDNIRLEHRLPYSLTTKIALSGFNDYSNNLSNWIAEGLWGLDMSIYQGGGGGPVSLGVWDVKWWDCNTCASLSGDGVFRNGVNVFLQNPTPVNGTHQRSVLNINYPFYGGTPITGWSRTDRLVMRAVLDTPVVGDAGFPSGVRSFTTLADDGVRLKVEELVGGVPVAATPAWNVINRWTDSSAVNDQGTFNFQFGRRYRITLEYFENTGNGIITLTITDGRFSFSDSPKPTAGLVPDVRPLPYANSSLILRNVLDLYDMPEPSMVVMEYQTKYRLDSASTARLEVSTDGGFNWTQDNLQQAAPPAFSAFSFSFSSPNISNSTTGLNNPATDAWQVRTNNLTAYKNNYVIIRFRLDRLSTNCVRPDNCNGSNAYYNPSLALTDGYYSGWWITPVRIQKVP